MSEGQPLGPRAFANTSFHEPIPPLWPYLLLCAVAATCIDFGHFHQLEHSDSIVPILVSLQRWTPFYWERDRFGMLLPLLALPIHNPFFNLLIQEWLSIFAGLAAFFLVARYMLRDKVWPAAAMLVTGYFLIFVDARTRFSWFSAEQPYGSSISLAVAALLILETESNVWRRVRLLAPAVFLMGLASWLNFSVAIPFVILVVLRFLLMRATTPTAKLATSPMLVLAVLASGIGIGRLLPKVATTGVTHLVLATIPIREWPDAWTQFAGSSWHGLGLTTMSAITILISPAVLGAVALWLVPDSRTRGRHTFVVATSLGTAATLFWLLVGTAVEVRSNLYLPRYGFPSLLFLGLMLAILAATPLYRVSARNLQRYILPFAGAVLLTASIWDYGFPSLSRARKDIDARMGTATGEIVAARANLIAGNYWLVWPAVFHANLVLYELGENRRVFGITVRGLPTRELWSGLPLDQLRAAAFVGDGEAESWLRSYGLPLRRAEHQTNLDIFAYLSPTQPFP